ncbi:MAG: glycosyltransferase [bacterium]
MKVLQINSVCGVGSTGRIATTLADTMKSAGIEPYIAYGIGESNYPDSFCFSSFWQVKAHVLQTRLQGKHAFYSKAATRRLVTYIEQLKPDVIHLHNLHGHYLNVEILFHYLATANIPVVWTLHDCWAFTGHCAHFDFVGCDKWRTGCHRCPQRRSYPISWLFDRSKESYHDKHALFTSIKQMTIVTPSEWLAQLTRQSFLSKYPVKVINNAIDLGAFYPVNGDRIRRKLQLEDKFVILGVATGFGVRKGLKYFIHLAEQVDEKAQIVLVGVNDDDRRHLPSGIIAIDRTESVTELAEFYSMADVFVNPTMEDNFPTVNIEALACGTPVVTFDTGGSPETIDAETGIIVPIGDLAALHQAVNKIRILGKDHYSNRCVIRAAAKFSKAEMFMEYISLYRSLLR